MIIYIIQIDIFIILRDANAALVRICVQHSFLYSHVPICFPICWWNKSLYFFTWRQLLLPWKMKLLSKWGSRQRWYVTCLRSGRANLQLVQASKPRPKSWWIGKDQEISPNLLQPIVDIRFPCWCGWYVYAVPSFGKSYDRARSSDSQTF